jgi:hypothetical protein
LHTSRKTNNPDVDIAPILAPAVSETSLTRIINGAVLIGNHRADAIQRMNEVEYARYVGELLAYYPQAAKYLRRGDAGAVRVAGEFGTIWTEFKGRPNEAVAHLLQTREGEAPAALSHPEVGEIDLVWGEAGTSASDGYGLAKIEKYHPEVLDDLQGVLDSLSVKSKSANRIILESDTHKAAVSLEWFGKEKKWLLSEYKKEASPDKTIYADGRSSTDRAGTTTPARGLDETIPQTTAGSQDKRLMLVRVIERDPIGDRDALVRLATISNARRLRDEGEKIRADTAAFANRLDELAKRGAVIDNEASLRSLLGANDKSESDRAMIGYLGGRELQDAINAYYQNHKDDALFMDMIYESAYALWNLRVASRKTNDPDIDITPILAPAIRKMNDAAANARANMSATLSHFDDLLKTATLTGRDMFGTLISRDMFATEVLGLGLRKIKSLKTL